MVESLGSHDGIACGRRARLRWLVGAGGGAVRLPIARKELAIRLVWNQQKSGKKGGVGSGQSRPGIQPGISVTQTKGPHQGQVM